MLKLIFVLCFVVLGYLVKEIVQLVNEENILFIFLFSELFCYIEGYVFSLFVEFMFGIVLFKVRYDMFFYFNELDYKQCMEEIIFVLIGD